MHFSFGEVSSEVSANHSHLLPCLGKLLAHVFWLNSHTEFSTYLAPRTLGRAWVFLKSSLVIVNTNGPEDAFRWSTACKINLYHLHLFSFFSLPFLRWYVSWIEIVNPVFWKGWEKARECLFSVLQWKGPKLELSKLHGTFHLRQE